MGTWLKSSLMTSTPSLTLAYPSFPHLESVTTPITPAGKMAIVFGNMLCQHTEILRDENSGSILRSHARSKFRRLFLPVIWPESETSIATTTWKLTGRASLVNDGTRGGSYKVQIIKV